MTIEIVASEIQKFLSSPTPEVLCIRGKWGVGKTFSWREFAKKAAQEASISLNKYAYVSLFGINSLDQLKYAIFENSVNARHVGLQPSLETFRENWQPITNTLGRKVISHIQHLPVIRDFSGGLAQLSFLSVGNQIICIDDLERKGKDLSLNDVLGLVAHLKDEKQCKVALIFNEDELEDEKETFDKYEEKMLINP